jgi:exodeoxyribonuclease VII large subunit
MPNPEILSVSQYLDRIAAALKGERGRLMGEVSALKRHQNGHYYFSLLDKTDQSKMDCVIWSSQYSLFGVELKEGIEVIATVAPNFYKPHGKLSFIVSSLELAGEGALKLAYEKLKAKLEAEGLFSDSRKRALPEYPQRIGIITSKTGAVINDFNTNIGSFGYKLFLADSRVEGADAIEDLLSAINSLKKYELDVLVMIRGGGGLEAFQAFNNENLVRAVAEFPVPVITGIGHDKDVPLVALASDRNVSTPTAVANLLNSTWIDARSRVAVYQERIFAGFQSKVIDVFKEAEHTLLLGVSKIEGSLARTKDRINTFSRDLLRGVEMGMNDVKELLLQSGKTLELMSPERQLSRGYSIIRTKSKVVKKVSDVKKGDELDITLSDGIIHSQII